METPGHATQIIGTNNFRVRSQSDPSKFYTVSRTGNGLVCECPDHRNRRADCKHIKVVLDLARKNVFGHNGFRIMQRSKLRLCKFCDSGNIIKKGFKKNKSGSLQRFRCKGCKREFTTNFGFEKKQYDENVITGALQMYYTGMSVRDIADHYEMMGTDVSFKTIYNWVDEYSKLAARYLNGIVP